MTAPLLKGALFGCGFVSQYHLDAWSDVSESRIVAACDPQSECLRRVGLRWPELRLYSTARELLESEHSLDFVEICTGPEAHADLTALAAERGLHVLCQKPAARRRHELIEMIDACRIAQVRLMIHENWRFRSWYRVLRSLIESGCAGEPIRLRLAHRDTRALREDGFRDQPFLRKRPELILLEMGPHLVDTARYLLGEVAWISATLGHFGNGGHVGEDLATLSLGFESGALGLLDLSWCAHPDLARPEWALNETVLEGREATLKLQADGSFARKALDGTSETIPVPLPLTDAEVYLQGYQATLQHFIWGLIHGTPHETSGEQTLRTMDVVWAGYQSQMECRRIHLNEGGKL